MRNILNILCKKEIEIHESENIKSKYKIENQNRMYNDVDH